MNTTFQTGQGARCSRQTKSRGGSVGRWNGGIEIAELREDGYMRLADGDPCDGVAGRRKEESDNVDRPGQVIEVVKQRCSVNYEMEICICVYVYMLWVCVYIGKQDGEQCWEERWISN